MVQNILPAKSCWMLLLSSPYLNVFPDVWSFHFLPFTFTVFCFNHGFWSVVCFSFSSLHSPTWSRPRYTRVRMGQSGLSRSYPCLQSASFDTYLLSSPCSSLTNIIPLLLPLLFLLLPVLLFPGGSSILVSCSSLFYSWVFCFTSQSFLFLFSVYGLYTPPPCSCLSPV